jgi:hypothetical protein
MLTHRAVPRSKAGWPPSPSTGCGGGHLYSLDLRNWFFGENAFGHNSSNDAQCDIQIAAHAQDFGRQENTQLTSRQRPTVYVDRDGSQYLYTGASGNSAGPNVTEYGHSFTLVQQIRT